MPQIKATVVGSYPVPSWLVGNTSRLVLRDAVMTVLKTQELAGLDLITDGELVRFDPSHPETNGMIDYFVARMDGIRSHFATSDFDRFRADRASSMGLLTAGMVVDGVCEVCNIAARELQPPPEMAVAIDTDFVRGLAMVEDKMLILLDVARLVGNALVETSGTKAA